MSQPLGRVAILGGGVIGEMVLGGLIRSGVDPFDVVVSEHFPERAAELEATYGVRVTDAADAAAGADVLVVAVKPQDMSELLDIVESVIEPDSALITVAAGLTTTYFEARVPQARVVRVMPNLPGTVGEGMTAIAPGKSADAAAVAAAHTILGTVGKAIDVDESQLDLVTAVSGSGPAYVFLLAESMRDAAIELGLTPELAAALVRQTVVGAAALLKASEAAPEDLRARVTSKKGTTDAAVTTLEARGVREAMHDAMQAALVRAKELGN